MNDSQDEGESGQPMTFVHILSAMNEEGGFEMSVLVTGEGLLVASSPNPGQGEATGALASLLHEVSHEVEDQLDLEGVDEVTIRDKNRFRLACRQFEQGSDDLILAALVPPGSSYRRVTNRAIARIKAELA